MKKCLAILLSIVMLIGTLAGCGTSGASTSPSTPSAAPSAAATTNSSSAPIKVALLTAMGASESWQSRINLATTLGKDYNMDVTNIECNGNASTQAQQIESAVEAGYKAIIISPADVNAIIPAVKKATAAGVPVISTEGVFDGASASINIPEYDSAFFMGQKAAEWLNTNWPDKTQLNVLDLDYQFLENCIQRNKGFMDGLEKNAKAKINVVADVSPKSTQEAETMSESALQANTIDVCMSTNGDFLYGFILACQNQNIDLNKVAGFTMDATPSSLKYLKTGTGIYGICAWSTPKGQVTDWLEATKFVLSDQYKPADGTKQYDLDFNYITKDTVDQAIIDFGVK